MIRVPRTWKILFEVIWEHKEDKFLFALNVYWYNMYNFISENRKKKNKNENDTSHILQEIANTIAAQSAQELVPPPQVDEISAAMIVIEHRLRKVTSRREQSRIIQILLNDSARYCETFYVD